MARLKELPVPASAYQNRDSVEIMRAWIVEGGLHVSLQPAFENPATWGLLLVDLARHAARASAAEGMFSESEALAAIWKIVQAEWLNPTDKGTTSPMET